MTKNPLDGFKPIKITVKKVLKNEKTGVVLETVETKPPKWPEDKVNGLIPLSPPKRKFPHFLPEAYQFIYDCTVEFNNLWPAVLETGPLNKTTKLNQRKAAIKRFHDPDYTWSCITLEALKHDFPWGEWRTKKERKDFQVKLLVKILEKHRKDKESPLHGCPEYSDRTLKRELERFDTVHQQMG